MSSLRPVSLALALALLASAPPATRAASPSEAADRVLSGCTVDPATGWVAGCPGSEVAQLHAALDAAGTDAALAALAELLGADHPAQRALGASELARLHDNPVWTGSVKAETADALGDAASGQTAFAMEQALPAVARAAVLAGRTKETTARLDALGPAALAAAAPGLVAQGDPSAAWRLLEHADPRVRAATLDALAEVRSPGERRLAAGCAKAAELVTDPLEAVAAAALTAAARCGGEAASRSLAAARDRRSARTSGGLSRALVVALGELCESATDRPPASCAGAAELLSELVGDEASPEAVRAEALWTLYLGRPDGATGELARAHSGADGALGQAASAVAVALGSADEVAAAAPDDAEEAPGDTPGEAEDEDEAGEPAEDAEAAPEKPRVSYSGKWSGSLSGGGSLSFTVRGSSVSGAKVRVGGKSLSLRGKLRGSKLHLTGRHFEDYLAVSGRLSGSGKGSGSFQGGVAKKAVKGSWSVSRR